LDSDILDEGIFNLIVKKVKNIESHFKGCLLEGFPNNMVSPLSIALF
jgi:hypothetical protein